MSVPSLHRVHRRIEEREVRGGKDEDTSKANLSKYGQWILTKNLTKQSQSTP